MFNKCFSLFLFVFAMIPSLQSQTMKTEMKYTVSMPEPARQVYLVKFECNGLSREWIDVKMPVWMPGYYQILNYADNVSNFHVKGKGSDTVKWERANFNTWRIYSNRAQELTITYAVKAVRNFVATNFLDEQRGFIAPTGTFMHVDGMLDQPVTVTIEPYSKWNRAATGLEPVPGKQYSYTATDFDVLYDSPILAGNLEELPSFTVKGVPHYFIGYKPGQFDRAAFMNDLKKVIEAAVDLMGDIPFKHYTFIAIGPGGGGIEHLNSTAISFDGTGMDNPESRKRMLSFLAHEYFHHYNAKRIRPVELGPFDYDKGSRTEMLWVAEGITSYYEAFLLKKAGITSETDVLKKFERHILNYENKPGRLFQSVSQASYDTWADGPFGRTGDDVNKTISYYDKGPALAMLLDFKIRHESANKRSLDDVMRTLYKEYYQAKKRGYTPTEFRTVCEQAAGVPLGDFFDYIYTVKDVDYPKYLAYAGLKIDTAAKAAAGAWLGIGAREKNDTLTISSVDWESPAWMGGVRPRQILKSIDGKPATMQLLRDVANRTAGSIVQLQIIQDGTEKAFPVILSTNYTRSYAISRITNANKLQSAILSSWLRDSK
jgi:predicted metalloprotease with PDZ domain